MPKRDPSRQMIQQEHFRLQQRIHNRPFTPTEQQQNLQHLYFTQNVGLMMQPNY